jgi:arsenate reductase (thioredoxin)
MTKPIALILCTGNSCRSQMAEAFLRKFQGDQYEVHSAGTNPAKAVHPLAIKVMAEIGIDISKQSPKALSEVLGKLPVRHVITVCDKASQSCPRSWPGVFSRTEMPFDDPDQFSGTAQATLSEFRRIRDLIEIAMKLWKPPIEESP